MDDRRAYVGRHKTMEMKVVRKSQWTKVLIAAISGLVGVMIISMLVLFLGKEKTYGTFVSVEKASSNAIPVVTSDYLNGRWTSENGSLSMEAVIQFETIVVNWVGEDSTSLYWAGSFAIKTGRSRSFDVVSIGDTERMKNALLASRNTDKIFQYTDGVLSFTVSLAGTSTKVTIKKTR